MMMTDGMDKDVRMIVQVLYLVGYVQVEISQIQIPASQPVEMDTE